MGKTKVNAKNAKKTDVWYKVLAIVIGVVLLFGLCVAIIRCMPAARASWARRPFALTTIVSVFAAS